MGKRGGLGFWEMVYEGLLGLLCVPPGTGKKNLAFQKDLGSGFDLDEERAHRRAKLRRLCDSVVMNPLYEARDINGIPGDETFCNQAFAYIAREMGCDLPKRPDGHDMLANELFDHMAEGNGWRSENRQRAAAHANKGGLAAAIRREYPNGHVAALRGGVAYSPSFKANVPIVANVGRKGQNGIKKVSEAFSVEKGEPEYFTYGTV